MNKHSYISPKILKGFRDFLPAQQSTRNYCIAQIQEVFARFCYAPIDTPILEYEEVLLGKGGGETDKQVYCFTDQGKRNIAMRFDLTVPFARFVAMHHHELAFPFARYHIGKVFRGENTQKGRYREFTQCDFDIVGTDTVSADITIIETIVSALQALGIHNVKIHISHRELITSLLSEHDEITQIEVMRIIDKIKKIGNTAVQNQLASILPESTLSPLLECITNTVSCDEQASQEEYNHTVLATIQKYVGKKNPAFVRLSEILTAVGEIGLGQAIMLDTSITRGLDYYTGFVCETFVSSFEDVGSICSGGRYNNLTGIYTKHSMPGVGASIGLDRLLSIFESGISVPKVVSVAIYAMEQESVAYCHTIMKALHDHKYCALVYSPRKGYDNSNLKDFFKFTDTTHPDFSIVIGNEERTHSTITITHIKTKRQLRNVAINTGLTFIHEQSSIAE